MVSRSIKHRTAERRTPLNPVVAAYERTVAILHEQLADCRKERDAAIAREQDAHAQLMQIVTAQAFAPHTSAPPIGNSVRNMRRGAEESDPFREVPFGDPMASFKTEGEASLMSDELLRALGTENGADHQ